MKKKSKKIKVDQNDILPRIQPGEYLGVCYAAEYGKSWGGRTNLFIRFNVKIDDGSIPIEIRYASLLVIVFVLPLPAPANIKSEPSICFAAVCCESFNDNKKFSDIFFSINYPNIMWLYLKLYKSIKELI